MSKRVVILHPAHWEQAMGGAELQIFYLVKELKKQGFEVHYIFEDKGNTIKNDININLHPLRRIKIKKWFGQRWFLYRIRIFKKLEEIKPAVIYTRFYSSWSGFASIYASKEKIKHIWAIASDNDVEIRQKIDLIIHPFDYIEKYYVNYSFKNSTFLITQNKYQLEQVKKQYHRDCQFIPKGTEIKGNMSFKKDYDKLKVVWVANLKTVKRPELFIEIVQKLGNNPCFEFTMIGRQSSKYKKLIKNTAIKYRNFNFLGEVPNSELHKILKEQHILMNLSDYEALPNTFLEAWSNKLIVVSRKVNPDDILTNNKIGFICPSIDGIVQKLLFLSQNIELLTEMSNNAYTYVKTNHCIEINIKKIISLIQNNE